MLRLTRSICIATLTALFLRCLCACVGGGGVENDRIPLPDTLRVATLYSPLSFFLYRGDTLGYDYTLVREFTRQKGLHLDIHVAPALEKAIEMLDSGVVDVIAYSVPVTSEYRKAVLACGPENLTTQVLVQPRTRADDMVRDVTDLVGRDIWVQQNTKYRQRLENLNGELGGGINIHILDRDTIVDEDMVAMVSNGEIELSLVDSDVARFLKPYYKDVDMTVPVSFEQKSSWAVALDRQWLADSLSAWFDSDEVRTRTAILAKQYYDTDRSDPEYDFYFTLSKGRVSPYDDLFRREAARIGWDWRLMAAQAFVESRFTNDLVSWAGARGIMQVMPSTAEAYGVSPDNLVNPATSIRVAADILKTTGEIMQRYTDDPDEQLRFTVAAYNSGAAHILDAIALADKYGKNPGVWKDNVEAALMMKNDPRFYNDSVVRYGYFRGRQTRVYVNYVFNIYDHIKKNIPL